MTKEKITCDEFWTDYELTDGVASIWSLEQILAVLPDDATEEQAIEVLEGMKARVGGNPKDHGYWDADEGFSANDVENIFDELFENEDREDDAVPADLDSAG